MIKVLLLTSLLFVTAWWGQAQRILDFDSFSIEDGFSSSKPNVFLQDRKGFIWVGTWNGLTRFDGYECVVYKSGIGNEPRTISNREVTALLEDERGNIWIGTSYGLNRLNPRTDEIDQYPFESRIMTLFEDAEGMLWVGTRSDGLFRVDPETGEAESFLTGSVINDVVEELNGELWVATYNGLVNLNRATKTFVRFIPNPEEPERSINNNTLTQLALGANGELWIGSWGGGVSRMRPQLDKDSLRFEHFVVREGPGSLRSNDVYRLHYDFLGNLWIGTWDEGLALLDSTEQMKSPDQAVFHTFVSDLSDPYSISGNNISALMVDRSGILWVGSAEIDRTSVLQSGIKRYSTARDGDPGLSLQSPVRSFAGDDAGNLWVGTANELLHYQKMEEGYRLMNRIPKQRYRTGNQWFQSNSVLALEVTPDGLLVGTDDAGLLFYSKEDLERGDFSSFVGFNSLTNSALPGNKINSLVWSRKYPNTLWIGTMQSGFVRAVKEGDTFRFEAFRSGNAGLTDDNIRAVLEDRDGIVWIATQRGLNRYDPVTGQLSTYLFSRVNDRTINDNVVNCLLEDKAGNLWIGTNTGLNRKVESYNSGNDPQISFKRYPGYDYVGSELIMNMMEGDGDFLYLGFYEGLVKFDFQKEEVVETYMMREYQRIGMERNASFVDVNHKMFMGGTNGFISFYPEDLDNLSLPPEVTLTDVLLTNESIRTFLPEGKKEGFDTSVPYAEELTFSYDDRIITFVFSAMDFKSPERNSYSYILEGFDTEWNYVGDRKSATYTNVPHGTYRFMVKGINSDGMESEQAAVLRVHILPPWWETPWAYAAYLLVLLGLLYFFKRYSLIRQKEKGKLMLEKVAHDKEEELYEMKVHFFTNITHEFRTPLTLILGPAEEALARNDLPAPVRKSFELIQRNTRRLLRLVNQLMEFRKVEKGKMELFLQHCNVVPIFNEMEEAFRPIARSRNIGFQMHYEPSEIRMWVDRDKFEKVLYNLLSNAFKFVDEEGKVDLHIALEDSPALAAPVLAVEVSDTGIGIRKDQQELIFDRFYQVNEKLTQSTGGIGLFLCKSFVEQHLGRIEVESEPGQGTTFRFEIPVDLDQRLGSSAVRSSGGMEHSEPWQEDVGDAETLGEDSGQEEDEQKPVVLVVEDDADLSDFISEGLSTLFSVHVAANGSEGLEMARRLAPELIISDIMMPVMDGFEMGKSLRNDLDTSHIPLVFLTAKTMREDEIEGLRIGAVDYIYKPFSMESLRLKLVNILEARGSVKEKYRTEELLEPEKITLSSLDEEFLRKAVAVVDKFMDDPGLDVEKLSEELSLSSNQTYRKIKALTGYTAKEFIRVQRLKIAAQLLVQKKRTISEIIYMVGFSSPSYFSRCFKDQYGCTPSEYIDKHDLKLDN